MGLLDALFGGSKGGTPYQSPIELFRQLRGDLNTFGDSLANYSDTLINNSRSNYFIPQISQPLGQAFNAVRDYISNSNLPQLLGLQAATSTDAATRAAVVAARGAAGARGGLAYGGGAGAIAARSAATAGASTGQALLGALVGADQSRLQSLGLLGDIGSRLSSARSAQAQLFEQRRQFDVQTKLGTRQRYLDILGQIAASTAGGVGGVTSAGRQQGSVVGGFSDLISSIRKS